MGNVEDDDEFGWDDPAEDCQEESARKGAEDADEAGPYSTAEWGEFAQDLNKAWSEGRRVYGENTGGLELDMTALEEKAGEVLRSRKETNAARQELPAESATSWLLERRQTEKERKLHWEFALSSVGLTNEMLFGVADDYDHLVQDSLDDNGRALREELRSRMQHLNRGERRALLRGLLESERIDEGQYAELMAAFGG